MNRHRTFDIVTLLSNSIFLSLYLYVCYHNRLAADDFHFLNNVNYYGIWDGSIHEYNTWSSRYSSVLFNHTILILEKKTGWGLVAFGILSLLAITASIRSLLSRFNLRALMAGTFLSWQLWNYALLITSIIYYLTPDIGETWHWLCSACTYLWAVITALYIVNWMIIREPKFSHHLLGYMACIYLGGASAPLALMMIVGIALCVIIQKSGDPWLISPIRSLASMFLILGSFFILYRATGNMHREAFFESLSLWDSFWLNFKMSTIIVLRTIWFIFLPIVLLPPLLFYISANCATDKKRFLGHWSIATITLGLGIFLYQWPITYKTQDIVAVRALLPVSIMLILYVMSFARIREIRNRWNISGGRLIVIPIMTFLISLFILNDQTAELSNYSTSYDTRMERLEDMSDCRTPIALRPLPSSGILKSAEVNILPTAAENRHLRDGLGLECDVILISE